MHSWSFENNWHIDIASTVVSTMTKAVFVHGSSKTIHNLVMCYKVISNSYFTHTHYVDNLFQIFNLRKRQMFMWKWKLLMHLRLYIMSHDPCLHQGSFNSGLLSCFQKLRYNNPAMRLLCFRFTCPMNRAHRTCFWPTEPMWSTSKIL